MQLSCSLLHLQRPYNPPASRTRPLPARPDLQGMGRFRLVSIQVTRCLQVVQNDALSSLALAACASRDLRFRLWRVRLPSAAWRTAGTATC